MMFHWEPSWKNVRLHPYGQPPFSDSAFYDMNNNSCRNKEIPKDRRILFIFIAEGLKMVT